MWLDALSISQRHRLSLKVNGFLRRGLFFRFLKLRSGRKRLKNWAKVRAFSQDERKFVRALSLHGLKPQDLALVLGVAPDKLVPKDFEEHWVADIKRLTSTFDQNISSPVLEHYQDRGIINPYLPILETQYKNLVAKLGIKRATGNSSFLADLCFSAHLQMVEYNVRRTVILEMNVQRLLGNLGAGEESDQFLCFKELFRSSQVQQDFYQKYPILCKYVFETSNRWVQVSSELISRLDSDWDLITEKFGIPTSAKLTSIESGGDTHRGGRTVNVLTFDNHKKIIYKPRSVRLEKEFFSILDELNKSKKLKLDFLLLEVLDRDEHGWVEYCSHESAKSYQEAEDFYFRLGALSAIVYALHGVDIFFENLIAHRDNPVIIDLETLFHTDLELKPPSTIEEAAKFTIRDSILSMGIFPRPSVSADGKSVFCVSVLGAKKDSIAPYFVTRLQNFGRSDMSLEDVPGWIPEAKSSPEWMASKQKIVSNVSDGFRESYRVIREFEALGYKSQEPFKQLEGIRSRVILRDTIYYGGLVMDAFHPDLLRDGRDKDWHYENLWNETQTRPYLESFISSEKRQLDDNDIPYFEIELGKARIYDDLGMVYEFEDALSGLEKARNRLSRLSEKDLELQDYLLHLSLGSGREYFAKNLTLVDNDHLTNAINIGEFILSKLITFDDKMSFINALDLLPSENDIDFKFDLGPANISLYDGVGGLSLFLAYLSQEVNSTKYREASVSLARTAFASIEKCDSVSGYNGLGALIYLSANLYHLFKEDWILDEGLRALKLVESKISHDKKYDFLLGCSGLIPAISAFIVATDSEVGRESLDATSKYLIQAVDSGEIHDRLDFLRGYSHGYTGVAYALAVVYSRTKDHTLLDRIRLLIRKENELLAGGNWTDEHKIGEVHQVSWCHGSAGIALGRILIGNLIGGSQDDLIYTAALKETKSDFWIESHCLCHGTLGNLEILGEVRKLDPSAVTDVEWEELSKLVFAKITASGWHSITVEQSMNLGLMTGLAGVGYAHLRSASSTLIPSVLFLQSPYKA